MTESGEKVQRKRKKYNDQSDSISEFQNISSDDIRQILSNQSQLMEKLESNKEMMMDFSGKLGSIRKELEDRKKTVKLAVPPIDTRSEQQKTLSSISMSPRQFVIKQVFADVSKLEDRGSLFSINEEHCGVPWYSEIVRSDDILIVYLNCAQYQEDTWSIDTNLVFKIIRNGGEPISRFENFVYDNDESYNTGDHLYKWDEVMNYLVDDTLTIEVHVTIEKMSGIYPKNLRSFDESTEDVSDVILIVGDEKFYALKKYLAAQSPYFKAMFLGGFQDSTMAEITLNGIESDDFQKYLEVLYGESAIDEYTVEGILHIADMYDTPIVIKKCEEFLMKESRKDPKKKLEISVRYNMENLKKKVLDRINTVEDIKAVLPGNINDMDPSIMAILLEKITQF